jgi:hypothetical protein
MGVRQMQSLESEQGVYQQWADQMVVLQVASGDLRVSLRGVIVRENQESVRFRMDGDGDIDIYKAMILAVEEDSWMGSIT